MAAFTGQVAVVTGASSGIGKAIALNLAMEGAIVCLIGRSLPPLENVKKEVESVSERLIPCKADLEKDQDIRNLVTYLNQSFEGIDILVHSAGIISLGDIGTASVDDYDRQFRVNVRAPYFLTQALLPMIRARKGQVVFINSSLGLHAKAHLAGYSASKHALKAVADALRDEANDEGLRVISIYPGRTATRMQSEILRTEGIHQVPETLMKPEDVAKVVLDALRLDRRAEITDIQVRPARKWN